MFLIIITSFLFHRNLLLRGHQYQRGSFGGRAIISPRAAQLFRTERRQWYLRTPKSPVPFPSPLFLIIITSFLFHRNFLLRGHQYQRGNIGGRAIILPGAASMVFAHSKIPSPFSVTAFPTGDCYHHQFSRRSEATKERHS